MSEYDFTVIIDGERYKADDAEITIKKEPVRRLMEGEVWIKQGEMQIEIEGLKSDSYE